jgi:hypothetical protein
MDRNCHQPNKIARRIHAIAPVTHQFNSIPHFIA